MVVLVEFVEFIIITLVLKISCLPCKSSAIELESLTVAITVPGPLALFVVSIENSSNPPLSLFGEDVAEYVNSVVPKGVVFVIAIDNELFCIAFETPLVSNTSG